MKRSKGTSGRAIVLVLIVGLIGILLCGAGTRKAQAADFFLHGMGSDNNPSALFMDGTSPASKSPKYKDSPAPKFSGGNRWKEIGTWNATLTGTFTALSDLHVWLGLKNSDDIGTNFDLRAEVFQNDQLITSGEIYCIKDVTRNPDRAKEVTVSFRSFSPVDFYNGNVFFLKILTRIGTNGAGIFCKGHSSAVGLRLYFDANSRPSRFGIITSENWPPVADAGQDRNVTVGDRITLDGRNCYDPEGDLITYRWTIKPPSGSNATLDNPASVIPCFTPDAEGEYKITLVVSDGQAESDPDEVVIIATRPNVPPTAKAGPDQSVQTGSLVHLDGTGSSDPDGDPLTYHWKITDRPPESSAFLDDPSSSTPGFFVDKDGQYTIWLTVNDGSIDSLPEDVVVISAAPNAPPIAKAGDDQTVSRNTMIRLDGTGSSDPDDDPLTYSWTIVSRPPDSTSIFTDTNIDTSNSPTPQILADRGGDFVFELIVSDGGLPSAPDRVVVKVLNDPPVANAGVDQNAFVGQTVALDGSQSKDADGDSLTYQWSLTPLPPGSAAVLLDATTPNPTFVPDVHGIYIAQLQVHDGIVWSAPDTSAITVTVSECLPGTARDCYEGPAGTSGVGLCKAGTQTCNSAGVYGPCTGQILPSTEIPNNGIDEDCNGQDAQCIPGAQQACYTGPAGTAGVGICRGGARTCNAGALWGACEGQVLPGAEILNNGIDEDCDGHDAQCTPGTQQTCYTGPAGTAGVGICRAGTRTCNAGALWGACEGQVLPGAEILNNGIDEDCNGQDAQCIPGAQQACYTGPAGTVGIGACKAGTQTCGSTGIYGPCLGEVLPSTEIPNNGIDEDCNGYDAQCIPGAQQACYEGPAGTAGIGICRAGTQTCGTNSLFGACEGQVLPAVDIPDNGIDEDCNGKDATSGPTLPPDPAEVAPPIDPTVATTLVGATEFLYTGPDPIQTGVAPGTIETKRAAVLRGKVLTREGNALSGVTITILSRPEYGQTLSREDGMFDMAVNGGESITVSYVKGGYLSAQRQVSVPLQDFAWLPEVILLPKDTQITSVDLTANIPIQVAQGSVITDQDGTRQASLLIPQGTTAEIVLPDGSIQSATSLNVRITEYTVGTQGPKAMPAKLPPTVGYTYCVELSADEADAQGAKEVRFNQPLFHYVQNFLSFPVGMQVPVAYYDRAKGVWVPSDNGRVIKVISISSGLAQLDTDGNGTVDNGVVSGVDLGITGAERERLATLFSVGDTLWRVSITHFTPWDCNWPIAPPSNAQPPQPPPPSGDDSNNPDDPCLSGGSIIECESQVLRERLSITGIPFTLNYTSGRVPGRTASNTLKIPVSGNSIPGSLERIDLEIQVAGQKYTQSFSPSSGQSTTFTWDRQDVYGRTLNGGQAATIRIGYAYKAVYQSPGGLRRSFGSLSGVPITGSLARDEVILWQEQQAIIGPLDSRAQGLGGWTLNIHHAYDPVRRMLYGGDGSRRSAQSVSSVITTVAGKAGVFEDEEAVPATETRLNFPVDVFVNVDGSFYTSETSSASGGPGKRIRYVNADGIISTLAGSWSPDCLDSETWDDGIPAKEACISAKSFAVGPDANLYIASEHRVRRVGPDGRITTVAGVNPLLYGAGFSGDGGPATEAQLYDPQGIAFGSDGSLYIVDGIVINRRIRRVGPDGIIFTVAGSGQSTCPNFCSCGDGGPATNATFLYPKDVAVGPDGSLYIAEYTAIRKVGLDGIISTLICGMASYATNLPQRSWDEGIPASSAFAGRILSISIAPDGSLYFSACDEKYHQETHCFVRRIGTDGIVNTVAGGIKGFSGDGGPPRQAQINIAASPGGGIHVSPDGSLYIADTNNSRIRNVRRSLPGVDITNFTIPSKDGMLLHEFDSAGRHLRTLHALTGAALYQFGYDANGFLTGITDGSGNLTAIERDTLGNPTAIVAPFGQRTALGLDANGYLSSVTNPASENFGFSYTEDGLLTQMIDPKGNPRHYTYDAMGYLVRNDAPEGSFQTFTREEFEAGHRVTRKTALDRSTTYSLENLSTGQIRRRNSFPDGTQTQTLINPDGSGTLSFPDGIAASAVKGPDPRFNMESPLFKEIKLSTPGGLTYIMNTGRTAELSNPNDPLSLISLTESLTTNGRTYINFYDAGQRKYTLTTPGGRQSKTTIDTLGRMLQSQVTGLHPVNYSYDNRGRLITTRVGTDPEERTLNLTYNTEGYLDTITDPLGRATAFRYDAAGRAVKKILPDLNEVLFGYDANGNLTSITPPGRPVHAFNYTGLDLRAEYIPPDIGAGTNSTRYAYNADRQLTEIMRPDGQRLDFSYGAAGRLSSLGFPSGQLTYAYYPSTGNLKSIQDPTGGTLSFDYDSSLLTGQTWTGSVNGSVTLSYDNDFREISQTVDGTPAVAFSYDSDDLLTGAGSLSLSRSPQNGFITGTQIGNVTDAWTYNAFGEIQSYTASYSGAGLYHAQNTYDKTGRIIEKTETVDGVTSTYGYTYDSVGRLTEVKKDSTIISQYTYDGNGNRLSYTDTVNTVAGSYDGQDRLIQYGNTVYSHTANGELLSKTISGQTATFQYDVLGNLLSVTLPGDTSIDYVVDGLNRRIGKKVNGTMTQAFLYRNELNPVAELDGSNNIISQFVYASRINAPDYMIKNNATYRIITDHLGSPRVIVNTQTGQIAQRMDFDEFGRVIADTNPGFQPFGFAGGLYDLDTGLTRFGARDYDAETGRWTAKDPILFQGGDSNLYAYVLSDPVNLIDPMGQQVSQTVRARAGTISAELGAAQAASSAASQALQIRQKFTDDILKAGQLRAEEIDRLKQQQSLAGLDAIIQQANICNVGTIPNGTSATNLVSKPPLGSNVLQPISQQVLEGR